MNRSSLISTLRALVPILIVLGSSTGCATQAADFTRHILEQSSRPVAIRRDIDTFLNSTAERIGSTPGSELAHMTLCGMFMCGYSIYFSSALSSQQFQARWASMLTGDLVFEGPGYNGISEDMFAELNRTLENHQRPERLSVIGGGNCLLHSGAWRFQQGYSGDPVEISFCDVQTSGQDYRFGGRPLTDTIYKIELLHEITGKLFTIRTPYSTVADDGSVFWHASDRYRYAPGDKVTIDAALFKSDGTPLAATLHGAISVPGKPDEAVLFTNDAAIHQAVFRMPDNAHLAQSNDARAYTLVITGTAEGRVYTGTLPLIFNQYSGRLLNQFDSAAVDANMDGLYETLVVTASVYISQTGLYSLRGVLVDRAGNFVAPGRYRGPYVTTPFSVGAWALPITFRGEDIRASGHDGPYRLARAILADETSDVSIPIGEVDDGVSTVGYATSRFKNPKMNVTVGTYQLIRGNPTSSTLLVTMTLNYVNPGQFWWRGSLFRRDAQGVSQIVAESSNRAELSATSPITLSFSTFGIGKISPEEPVCVDNISIRQTSGPGHADNFVEHSAQGYCFSGLMLP